MRRAITARVVALSLLAGAVVRSLLSRNGASVWRSGWVTRARSGSAPRRRTAPTTPTVAASVSPWRVGAAAVLSLAIAATVGAVLRSPDAAARRHAALADSTWFADGNEYDDAQGWAFQPNSNIRQANLYQFRDFRSRYVDVIDGDRASWTPPACDCTRLTVWMFGGSTTYGLHQRDEHTIASALARVAHEHGITIDIHNKGRNGHLHWLEAELFAWELTLDDPPDLAIFYDGVNETWATSTPHPPRTPAVNPTTADLWASTGRSEGPPPSAPPEGELIERDDPKLDALLWQARTTVDRYDRSRSLSRATGHAHGVPVRYFWQPSRFSRPLERSEPHFELLREVRSRVVDRLQVMQLPDDVLDVSGALRAEPGPLFTDDVHHNERAARVIAEAMYARLSDDLAALASVKGAAS